MNSAHVYRVGRGRRRSHVTGKAAAIGRRNQARDFISQRLPPTARWVVAGRPQVRRPAPTPTLRWRYEISDMNQARARYRAVAKPWPRRFASRRTFYKHDPLDLVAARRPSRSRRRPAGSRKTIANLVCMHTTSWSVSD